MTGHGELPPVVSAESPQAGSILAAVPRKFEPITSLPPSLGCILGCFTPDEDPELPGKKFRPVLLLEVVRRFPATTLLRVAYGGAQDTSAQSAGTAPKGWEVEFSPGADSLRTTQVTKVDFSKIFFLEFVKEFFQKDGLVANYGRIPASRDIEVLAAIELAGKKSAAIGSARSAPRQVLVDRVRPKRAYEVLPKTVPPKDV